MDGHSDEDEDSFSWFAESFQKSSQRGASRAKDSDDTPSEEEITSTADLAVSLMFSVAILRQSLAGLLEVAFLLADEKLGLRISREAEAFVRFLFAGQAADPWSTTPAALPGEYFRVSEGQIGSSAELRALVRRATPSRS